MNKLWLLLLLVIPYQSIDAQEAKHAPTVALCQAEDCINVDPDHRTDYLATLGLVDTTQYMRLVNFLDRHHLTWDQFLAEDEQGQGR